MVTSIISRNNILSSFALRTLVTSSSLNHKAHTARSDFSRIPLTQKLLAFQLHASRPANTPWQRAFNSFQPMTIVDFADHIGRPMTFVSMKLNCELGLMSGSTQYTVMQAAKRLGLNFDRAILVPEV